MRPRPALDLPVAPGRQRVNPGPAANTHKLAPRALSGRTSRSCVGSLTHWGASVPLLLSSGMEREQSSCHAGFCCP